MCLLVLAWQSHPRYRLVVAANRDEFHEREAAALALWPPPARILAGRDLRAGGTWLGVGSGQRFGVVTNFRELAEPRPAAPSRGGLIPRYLEAADGPADFFAALAQQAPGYAGFNLLLSDAQALWYGSNRATPFARALAPGVYGLANELLDTPWPKLRRVRAGFDAWLARGALDAEELFALLADRTQAPGASDPTGGLPRDWAQALSAPFVLHPQYGTRCSSVLLVGRDGTRQLTERRFAADGSASGERSFVLAPDTPR